MKEARIYCHLIAVAMYTTKKFSQIHTEMISRLAQKVFVLMHFSAKICDDISAEINEKNFVMYIIAVVPVVQVSMGKVYFFYF